jgi:hypothetical protein
VRAGVVAGVTGLVGVLVIVALGWDGGVAAQPPEASVGLLLAGAAVSLAGLVGAAAADWLRVRRGGPPGWEPAVVVAVSQVAGIALTVAAL